MWHTCSLTIVTLLGLLVIVQPQELAKPCDVTHCDLPDCRCSNTIPPLEEKKIPQIVHLTFNEAVTSTSERFFEQLFTGEYKNPNGCNIRGTHYVSHEYSDYSLVHTYWSRGHEIGSISISHENNVTYWQLINETGWALEMDGMRDILSGMANVPIDEIQGIRSPDLQNGGNAQFKMMKDYGFLYDSSLPTEEFAFVNMDRALWPYTFDYLSIQDCQIEPCLNQSFPGIWEYPILMLEDSRDTFGNGQGEPCSFFGACQGYPDPDPKHIFVMLKKNFDRVYNGNRAPFGLHAQTAFFVEPQTWMFDGYVMFVQYLAALEDVYIVPVIDGLKFVQNPVALEEAATYEPFDMQRTVFLLLCKVVVRNI
ncbi:hypothetical protein TCAL_05954 [Tigriopus californicus]|uniref:Uncharacterized protein n=1 Tax=Tigriopus californicus TaxID=6832 RepID=A0A553PN87_TIGCA|nr:hypothetical protein TCAL_05954 [Tigriopus californicus]